MSGLKKLVGQTAIYGVSTILGRAVNFLLVPFYTNKEVLQPSEFGKVTELYAYVAFLNIIFQFGLETTYFRYAVKLGDEKKAFNYVQSILLMWVLSLSVFLLLSAQNLANWLDYKGSSEYFLYLTVIVGIDAVVALPFARLRQRGHAKKFAVIRISNILLNVGLNIFFLKVCKDIYKGEYLSSLRPFIMTFYSPSFGVGYVFLSNLIANAIFIPLLLREIIDFQFRLHWEMLKELLKYAFPVMVLGLAAMINEVIDRNMLKGLLKKDFNNNSVMVNVGVYGAVYKLSIFMSLVIQAFRYAAEPFFFSRSEDKKAPATYALVLKWFVISCTVIFLIISMFRKEVGEIVLSDKIYHQGLYLVPILLLANLFLGAYYNQSIWYKISDKTYFGTIIGVIGALITIVLNFVLIPQIGYLASALATLVCYFSMSAISYIIGQKYFPVPYPVGKILFYILFASSIITLTYLPIWDTLNYGMQLLIKVLSVVVFMSVIYILDIKKLKKELK